MRLADALEARGFESPGEFKALVVDLGTGGTAGRWYDYRGTSTDREDWWPASSIKLFAAVAALERVNELDFPLRSWLTFHYEEKDVEIRLDRLVRKAITESHNPSYDALAAIVGLDRLNRGFFTASNGLPRTVLLRGYGPYSRDSRKDTGKLRESPRITIRYGDRAHTLPAREGEGEYDCPDTGNCTTLQELAEAMRRVMLHQELAPAQRFDLTDEQISLLRDALAGDRKRGERPVESLQEGYGARSLRIYHKPGYALKWMSVIAFVRDPHTGHRWIVAAAARPGRGALDAGMRHIGALLAAGTLEPESTESKGKTQGHDNDETQKEDESTSQRHNWPEPKPCPPEGEWPDGMGCVRGGVFTIGSEHRPDEQKPGKVYIDTFYLDRHEVTNAEYDACIEAGECDEPKRYDGYVAPKQPVVAVSWYDAVAFCERAGKRLPTEAEWERGASGPNDTTFPWGNEWTGCEDAIIKDPERGKGCGRGTTWPVGSRPAGHWGLYDMAGNVHEWVHDHYSECLRGCDDACGDACFGVNPQGPCDGARECPGHPLRSVRGGSWYWPLWVARAADRRGAGAPNRGPHRFGFRCARDFN